MLVAVVVLTAVLIAGVASLVAFMAKGWLTLDVGWGRSLHALGPLVIRVDAPRELVFAHLTAPYLGRVPREMRDKLEVLVRGDDLVVAAHHSDLGWYTATTVEAVAFEAPHRITFRHLRGPVPQAWEEFVLAETEDGATELTYRGQLGLDWWLAGRLAARFATVPVWMRQVSGHLEAVKPAVEEHARRRQQRAGSASQEPGATGEPRDRSDDEGDGDVTPPTR